jgi:hypothetical protein
MVLGGEGRGYLKEYGTWWRGEGIPEGIWYLVERGGVPEGIWYLVERGGVPEVI